MIASAKARHIRMSAQKVRLVLALIRGKSTQESLTVLSNTHKRAAETVDKLLRSAIANAKNKGLETESLFVSKICADEGSTWKRNRAASFGRGSKILKRTCHITVEIDAMTAGKKSLAAKAVKAVKSQDAKSEVKKAAKTVNKKTTTKVAEKTEKKAKSVK
ncbi:MAG: 50S ribosomal protein L22 [Candidatus Omnitrophica bacterium]|nr:50S ribosomal protein L22 [Candidatus Omnitrophota bacterium]